MPDTNQKYHKYAKPALSRMLSAVGLDVVYHKGEGNYLYFFNEQKEEVKVSDFVGGYGASLFGHNHPEINQVISKGIEEKSPQWVQGSIRRKAADLAELLKRVLKSEFGQNYISTFASTGSEAVEIALKHAELAYQKRIQAELMLPDLSGDHSYFVSEEIAAALGIEQGNHPELTPDWIQKITQYNKNQLAFPAQVVAVKGAYHGVIQGEADQTEEEVDVLSEPNGLITIGMNPDGLKKKLNPICRKLIHIQNSSKQRKLVLQDFYPVKGVLIEPIQGEGGVVRLPGKVAAAWQQFCKAHHIPLIADEIHCGMGRTGSFTYSKKIGLKPDYVLFSKSLGGGIAKVSVCCVQEELYQEEFSMLHASTFAEDDMGCAVAIEAIRLAQSEKVQKSIEEKGKKLKQELKNLMKANSDILKEVRGEGLMLGLVFDYSIPLYSSTLYFFRRESILSFAIAGYLLHRHQIRVAPTLGDSNVIRLEPSYLVSDDEVDHLVKAFSAVCEILRTNNTRNLLGHVLKLDSTLPALDAQPVLQASHDVKGLRKVAFIGHFINPDDLALWDPFLGGLKEENYRAMLDRMKSAWQPRIYNEIRVKGKERDVCLYFVGLPVYSVQMLEALSSRDLSTVRHTISFATDLAIEAGCEVVGLGGYTSILTRNGKTLSDKRIAVTTGNSYTVASAIVALTREAEARGVNLEQSTAAVVGAGGNIGSVMAQLLASKVKKLILVGRENRLEKLLVLQDKIQEQLREMGGKDTQIIVSDNPYALKEADLIATATNSASPIIYHDMLKSGSVLICDVSVPGDIDDTVLDHYPDLKIIKGGVIYSHLNPDFYIPGIPLDRGNLFACMTETILMGMEDINQHYSYGDIHLNQVTEIAEIAAKHGFDNVVSKTANSY